QFDHTIVEKAEVDVLVNIDKQDYLLLLDFTIEGTVFLPCDRCGEEMGVQLEGYNELIVKFGEEAKEESEDVIVLPSKAHEIDVAQFIYEYVTTLIPLRNVHEDDENGNSTCNPDVLKELEKYQPHEEKKTSDPRWDVLKNINPN